MEGASVLMVFEDVTALEEAEAMRRDFVANVSHELRTPLTALVGFIETLRGPARDDAAARERFLGIMEREAARMNRLVGDLLSLSRVESEERMRPTAMVDISAVLKGAMQTLSHTAAAQGVELVRDGETGVLRVPGDGGQRFVVVDYKTNLLGEPGRPVTAADYGPAEPAAAMLHSHYPLQAMLYSVVLHRFLRWRLPGYRPERHLGGVLYLYLRGMCGPESPVVGGHPSGVFSWSPPAALVTAASDLLAGEGVS